MNLIIQSNAHQIESYQDLLDQHQDLTIEVTDFAYPHNYGLEGEKLVEFWLNHEFKNRISGIHGSYYDLLLHSLDTQISEITRKRYLWNLGIADQLDTGYVIFHSNYQPERGSKSYITRWLDSHRRFINKYSSEYETQVFWKNSRDPTPKIFTTLNQMSDNTLQFCLDIANIHMYSPDPIQTWIDAVKPFTSLVYIHDTLKNQEELPLGAGELDLEHIFTLLQQELPNTKLVLQMEGIDKILKSLEYISTLRN